MLRWILPRKVRIVLYDIVCLVMTVGGMIGIAGYIVTRDMNWGMWAAIFLGFAIHADLKSLLLQKERFYPPPSSERK